MAGVNNACNDEGESQTHVAVQFSPAPLPKYRTQVERGSIVQLKNGSLALVTQVVVTVVVR